jgi:hypothetical protein
MKLVLTRLVECWEQSIDLIPPIHPPINPSQSAHPLRSKKIQPFIAA